MKENHPHGSWLIRCLLFCNIMFHLYHVLLVVLTVDARSRHLAYISLSHSSVCPFLSSSSSLLLFLVYEQRSGLLAAKA